VIRHAISCDICGAEKKETNHWFVVYEHQGELRVSGWSPQSKIRPGSKHLCGQTCMNKLVVEFMDRVLGRAPMPASVNVEMGLEKRAVNMESRYMDTSLTSSKAYAEPVKSYPEASKIYGDASKTYAEAAKSYSESPKRYNTESAKAYAGLELESSARLITPPSPGSPAALPARPTLMLPLELVTPPARAHAEQPAAPLPTPVEEPPRYASRNWRAEAWEREREREREQRTGEHHVERAARRRSNS